MGCDGDCGGDSYHICFSDDKIEGLETRIGGVERNIGTIKDTNTRLFELYKKLDEKSDNIEEFIQEFLRFIEVKNEQNGFTDKRLEEVEEEDKTLRETVTQHAVDIASLKQTAKDVAQIKYLLFALVIGLLIKTLIFGI